MRAHQCDCMRGLAVRLSLNAGIRTLPIGGSLGADSALNFVNYLLGSRCTLPLDLDLSLIVPSRASEQLFQPHLMPVLRQRLESFRARVPRGALGQLLATASLVNLKLSCDVNGALVAAWQLPALQHLHLLLCKGDVGALLHAGSMPNLLTFEAEACNISTGGMEALASCSSLRRLDFVSCRMEPLPALASLVHLCELNLHKNEQMLDVINMLNPDYDVDRDVQLSAALVDNVRSAQSLTRLEFSYGTQKTWSARTWFYLSQLCEILSARGGVCMGDSGSSIIDFVNNR